MAAKKGGLGKGLDAIFMENATENSNSTVTFKISELEPNQDQPRREFDDETLAELADSIAQHGVLQPLSVSYTHLDVYKRQLFRRPNLCGRGFL